MVLELELELEESAVLGLLIFPHNIAGFGELAHLPDAPKLLVSQCMCTPSLEDLSW